MNSAKDVLLLGCQYLAGPHSNNFIMSSIDSDRYTFVVVLA